MATLDYGFNIKLLKLLFFLPFEVNFEGRHIQGWRAKTSHLLRNSTRKLHYHSPSQMFAHPQNPRLDHGCGSAGSRSNGIERNGASFIDCDD